jgi:transcriptional regulator GlxA family with amidase domain
MAELRRPQCLFNRPSRPSTLLNSLRSSLELLLLSSGLSSRDLWSLELEDHVMRLLILLLCPSLQGEEGDPAGIEDSSQKRILDPLLEWIRAHLDQPITLSDLEARSGYSRRNLQILFGKHLHCTPTEWVRNQRLEAIRIRMLCPQERDSVSSIAQEYGFTNASAFTRLFRQRFGVLPSQLLRQSR